MSRGREIWGFSAPQGQEWECSPVSDIVTSPSSCLTCMALAVRDRVGVGAREQVEEAGSLVFPADYPQELFILARF